MSQSVGQVIKRLRRSKGISQRQLQELSAGAINASWLANLETDVVKNPKPEKLELLANYLGTTLADIYHEAGIIEFPPAQEIHSIREHALLDAFRKLSSNIQDTLIDLANKLGSSEASGMSKDPNSKGSRSKKRTKSP